MMQHIGEDFSNIVKLDLLPGIKLKRSFYRIDMQYVTENSSQTMMHHLSMMSADGGLEIIVGRDVVEIHVAISDMSSLTHYQYHMRIDRLILLNLAYQLLHPQV